MTSALAKKNMDQTELNNDVSCSSETERNLRASIIDGCFSSLMVGLGETYLAAFVLALGHAEIVSGLISTIPLLAGGLIQLISPWGVQKVKSYKTWVVASALIQGLCFIPLAYAAWVGKLSLFGLMFVSIVYWSAGMATGPAWNAWLNLLVPRETRFSFFSRRNFFTHLFTLCALLLGGLLLEAGKTQGRPLLSFLVLFSLSGLFRLGSAFFLSRQSEQKDGPIKLAPLSFVGLRERVFQSHHGKILIYLLFFHLTVYISAPFFNPYMLAKLKMEYWMYMLMLSMAFVGRLAVMPMLKRWSQKADINLLMLIFAAGIAFLPAFWLVSPNLIYLLVVQFVSGMIWGGFELSSFLVLFNQIPQEERTAILCFYNLFNTIALVGGSLLGGGLMHMLGDSVQTYFLVFMISSLARLVCLFLFPEAKKSAKSVGSWIFTRTIGVRPSMGAIERPILAGLVSLPKRRKKDKKSGAETTKTKALS